MRPTRSTRIFAATTAAAAVLALTPFGALAQEDGAAPEQGAPAAAEVERKPWNDEEVLPLAQNLQRTISAVRSSWLKEPVRNDRTQVKQRAAKQMDQTIKGLETSSRQLAARIESGGGYEGTLNIARKIGTLLNDAEETGRRLDLGAWTRERIGPAMEAINALAPYYGSGPLYDVEQQKKIN